MGSAPPKIHSPATRLVRIFLATAVVMAAIIIFFFNPATHDFYPVCQFHRLTGLNCPGCGMTRSFYALLHGEWRVALRDNALCVTVLCGLMMRGGWFAANRIRGRQNGEFFPTKWFWPLPLAALVFAVLRNLAAFKFLSP